MSYIFYFMLNIVIICCKDTGFCFFSIGCVYVCVFLIITSINVKAFMNRPTFTVLGTDL